LAIADLVQDRVSKILKNGSTETLPVFVAKKTKRENFVRIPPRDALAARKNSAPTSANKNTKSFVFVGENWLKHPEKPIAVMVGFNEWKYDHTPEFLPEYRTVFVKRKFLGSRILRALLEFPEKPACIIVWSYTESLWVRAAAKRLRIPIKRMEDGFLRSFGAGLLHTTPHSLVLDDGGLYFNPKSESSLEYILGNTILDDELDEARAGLAIARVGKLTKYYNPDERDYPRLKRETGKKTILVVGQVEDDASLRFGLSKKMSNNDMVRRVRKMNPDAKIYYRPHPDVVFTNRKSSDPKFIRDICTVLKPEIPLHEVLRVVDHVYTMTSLVGMEALVNGKKVTAFGGPFYAGWGLTEDLQKMKRRNRSLSMEELFTGVYLRYPMYFHPVSRERITFLDLASYFFVERARSQNLFEDEALKADLGELEEFSDRYAAPMRVLAAIVASGRHGSLESGAFLEIVRKDFQLRDFPQITGLLIESANYNVLSDYVKECFAFVTRNRPESRRLIGAFLYHLSIAQKNAHGRVFGELPDLLAYFSEVEDLSEDDAQTVFLNYMKCLARNIQYQSLEAAIEFVAGRNDLPALFWKKIVNLLREKPVRSERGAIERNKLLNFAAARYRVGLSQQHPSSYDLFLNTVLYYVAIDQEQSAMQAYDRFLLNFPDGFSFANPGFENWGNLRARVNEFEEIFVYLMKKGEYDFAEAMLKSFEVPGNERMTESLWLDFYTGTQQYERFLEKFNSLSKDDQNRQRNVARFSRVMRCIGEFELARQTLIDFSKRKISPAKKIAILQQVDQIDFIIEAGRILASVPQPRLPKGVVFLASQTCFNSLAMLVPALVEVKKRGYAVINLTEGMLPSEKTGIDYIDQFECNIPLNLYTHKFDETWEIDWDRKKVKSGNVEFYQGFYERLSTGHRSFFVNLNEAAVYSDFMAQLKRSDTVLTVCRKIFRELVQRRNLPVSLVTGNSHVTPYSVIRDFCCQTDHALLSFVNVNVAYENYFSNIGGKYANTFCVNDLTVHKTIRAPFLARRDQFETWYEKNRHNDKFLKEAESVITVNRNSSSASDAAEELVSYLQEQRAAGKRIVCAFGKIPVDLGVPYDGGPGHADMADWLNHTVEFCGHLDDTILLVKPHPHELRPEIALDLKEGFSDLITVPMAANIKVLAHKEVNTHVLAPYLDLAVLWSGSACLELAAKGVPVVMCGYFGKHDYPVDLIYPEDRADYEQALRFGHKMAPDATLREKAALLISYMNTDEISLVNQYSLRQITNDKIGVPQWRWDLISKFLRDGDPHMERAADRILEKFEGIRH
jgi:hypothetical protein